MITLVRHMETDWNIEARFTAQAFHIRLNSTGITQAERMADRLEKVPFWAVFCSDQIRAIETAIIIASRHEDITKFVTDPRLREVNVGTLVGKHTSFANRAKFSTHHPRFNFRSIGGESRSEVIARQLAIMKDIGISEVNKEVLVVGHGSALRVLLEDLEISEILTRENFICLP